MSDRVRKAVREFVDKEINPSMDEWKEKDEAPLHDLFKKMGDLGFLGIRYDTNAGRITVNIGLTSSSIPYIKWRIRISQPIRFKRQCDFV